MSKCENLNKNESECFIDFKKYFVSQNVLSNLDLNDLFYILRNKGKIEGYSSISSNKNIIQDVSANIDFNKIKNSKTVLLFFIINPKSSIVEINELLETIQDSFSNKTEIIFEFCSDNNIKIDEHKYFIIYSGIEKNTLSKKDDDYQNLIYENKILKEENKKLKNYLYSLK